MHFLTLTAVQVSNMTEDLEQNKIVEEQKTKLQEAIVQGAFPAQLIAILLAAHMLLCTGAPVFTQRRFPARFLDDPVPADLLGNCGWIFSNEHSDFLKFHAALQCLFNINPVRKS